LELAFLSGDRKDARLKLTAELAEQVCRKKVLLYDKEGEEHYNLISALHKSLRGSDPDASLYWLARMLTAGEDPLYVARRMIRFASEDIGNAEPMALLVALAAKDAYHFLGSPEGELALAQCAIFLASCPKSNAVYKAYQEVRKDVEQARAAPVPLKLRNPVTELMAKLGYGEEYKYPHDFPGHHLPEDYLPENLIGRRYYQPSGQGKEAAIRRALEQLKKKGPKKS
jgi:putative ATPase